MTVFTDKVDINEKISLYEYGIIRNPKTNKCVVCTNIHELDVSFGDLMDGSPKPKVKIFWLGLDEVEEALEEAPMGYFEFIGSTKRRELKMLDNEYLTGTINSLEAYGDFFGFYG